MHPDLSLDWEEEMAKARPHDCVPLPSNHPLYILYTSGTTGAPKVLEGTVLSLPLAKCLGSKDDCHITLYNTAPVTCLVSCLLILRALLETQLAML